MTFRIHHAGTRALVAAATSQQGQCEALRDAFAGNVTVRIYGAGSQHLRTVTLAPFGINSNTPRGLTCGAVLADTAVAPTTPGAAGITPVLWEFRDGSTVIFDCDTVTHGAIKALCTPTFDAVVFTALASLPATDVIPLEPFQLVADGCWTWFNDPRAIYRNGATYFGYIDSAGTVWAAKYVHETEAVTTFQLSSTGFELDDHNNPGLVFLADGRLMATYAKHDADSVVRYRITTSAEDISAWSAEANFSSSVGVTTYANPHLLSATGKVYVYYRSNVEGRHVRAWNGTSWDTERRWVYTGSGRRPYLKTIDNGVDTIHLFYTSGHPAETEASVYHAYMRLVDSVETFYKSDGTLIGTTGINAASDGTLIYSGASVDGWVWDITLDSDGRPRVLYARFPAGHRYEFSRWTGSAWTTPVEITAAGSYLYEPEIYYSGGVCFDSQDPNTVYCSVQEGSSANWRMERWTSADNGATWSLDETMTPSPTQKNCRPFSVRDHVGDLAVLWWRGTYTTYLNYNTAIWGAG